MINGIGANDIDWGTQIAKSVKKEHEIKESSAIRNNNMDMMENTTEKGRIDSDKLEESGNSSEAYSNNLSESFKFAHIRSDDFLQTLSKLKQS